MSWKPYPKYKDSGVEWLGEIPEHWETVPLKGTFRILNGSTPKSGEPAYWDGEIAWATPDDLGSLSGDTLNSTKRTISQEGYDIYTVDLGKSKIKENQLKDITRDLTLTCKLFVKDRQKLLSNAGFATKYLRTEVKYDYLTTKKTTVYVKEVKDDEEDN